ncbi:MAG: cobalt transporter CbiM [Acidobacteriota bacterium]|nr:cobalt transporter CbiM [Acidobacteriota bacterium]
MHIPDGYLSPSTCALLYGSAAPFWWIALRRVKRMVATRMIPLLSVFAAFSFVIMMFNLPLPGGTTGHAIGIGIAAVVLGPWGAMVSVSIALAIQALFFGDGGITALGANCFNMGIAGASVAYLVYRAASGEAELTSPRRVFAAGLAGYAAINVSALLAAIEFGIQPLLFRDASGAPLYCPYPLRISIPAMMLGHLTFAGLAELTISAGVVRYLQSADVSLLRDTAPGAPEPVLSEAPAGSPVRWPITRKLWLVLAALLIMTPLGIIAAGSAWGEWTAQDFANPATRAQIAAASGNQPPPQAAPHGLERLSSLWTSPLARYAPPFIRSPSFGYVVSALAGTGLIILFSLLLNWIFSKLPERRTMRKGFVESTVKRLLGVLEDSLFAERIARGRGLLQALDPRVKVAGLFLLILAAAGVHSLGILSALFAAASALALLSGIPLSLLAVRVWLPALSFSGVIAIPALFLTPGTTLLRVPVLDWQLTAQGAGSAAYLLGRVLTSATLSVALVLTTEWNRVLKALRFFRVPVTVVVILGMTYRYLFLLLRTAHEMFESRRSRMVGILAESDRQRLSSASVGLLLEKSVQLSHDIHLAMQARGFRGEAHVLDEPAIRFLDWAYLAAFASFAAAALVLGR